MNLEQLVEFAKKYHPGFEKLPRHFLREFFSKYRDWTIVAEDGGRICGFVVYQDWGDLLNVIAVCNLGEMAWLLKARHVAKGKKVVYFDEEKMELRTLCRR
jgi:hypothetical protein